MTETITISKKELEMMIAEAVAKNTLPRKKKDFRDVHINSSDFEKINIKYPKVAQRLRRRFASQSTNAPSKEEKRYGLATPNDVYTRRRYSNGIDNYVHYKTCCYNIRDLLRVLSLAVMGATIVKDLDDDEFEYSLGVYEEFKNCFLYLYDKRLGEEERILETIEAERG